MIHTFGTIFRILILLALLVVGWFMIVATLHYLLSLLWNIPFSWTYALTLFGLLVVVKMFYPRNVFRG